MNDVLLIPKTTTHRPSAEQFDSPDQGTTPASPNRAYVQYSGVSSGTVLRTVATVDLYLRSTSYRYIVQGGAASGERGGRYII